MTSTQRPPAKLHTRPTRVPPGVDLPTSQCPLDTHALNAGGDLRSDQSRNEAQGSTVGAGSLTPGQYPHDAQRFCAGGKLNESASLLALTAATLDDIEGARIAMGNRLRAMRDDHGVGGSPEYQRAEAIHEALEAAEKAAVLELKRTLHRHPLAAWITATIGIGEKQGARLLAAIDDPYWNHAEDRPRRGPAELWAYCGFAPGQKRKKGQKSNWNAQAKMRAFLVAESCMKQMRSPYRADYDRARASWAERDTSDGHKHNHALRVVAKCVLRDLYLAAKEQA